MLTEFCLLAALTLNEDERAVLRTEINEWVKSFLPKLKRESTRTERCRLIASVERQEFSLDRYARDWRFCKFVGKEGIIFDEYKEGFEKFKLTSFQKKILRRNPSLENVFLGRSEIKEETGFWKLNDELKNKIISEGGEAVIFLEKFGNLKAAVRIQIFDAFLFSTNFGENELKWKTNLISDFKKVENIYEKDKAVVPIHENVVKNYANVELFQIDDENEEDCLGWITILQKCDKNIRNELKNESLDLEERKKIAIGLRRGFRYLAYVGIYHYDRKLENFLLLGGVVKICDFGLVEERTRRRSYREMGYCRRGSKYRNPNALFSGSPGFSTHFQLTGYYGGEANYFYFLFCDWKTSWSLLYRPIDENEREKIDEIIEVGKLSENKVFENQPNLLASTKKSCLTKTSLFLVHFQSLALIFFQREELTESTTPKKVFFHQMTLDRIENGEYVLQNTQFSVNHPPVIKIKQTRPYYDSSSFVANLFNQTGDNFYDDGVLKMELVNETLFMKKNCWYLLPQAYSLTLNKI
ncbi:unnamed protein product [Oikopleura dioica]|uniref:Protein kinase domain-containing protein n=1 Tax=Oikopleura dioica TaxID=34765 RepID=E4YXL8_OIKDI|nr:unnamed protein product [Oikopleura dioica]